MNNRLMMLFSAEEQYKKIVEEIDKYYTQTITKTTDKEEIKKLVEFYKKFQKNCSKIYKIPLTGIMDISLLILPPYP